MQMYIPIIMHKLEKAAKGKIFHDLDMKNAFHQIMLSLLLPPGVPSDLCSCQKVSAPPDTMTDIIFQWLDSAIVIFDNFLVVYDDYTDAYHKLVGFITTCSERNVILGLAKSKVGYPEATFFVNLIEGGTYQLTPERKVAVTSLAMPQNQKQAQLVCGPSICFGKNIINYANICAPLNNMCAKGVRYKIV